uniref:Uncharacterized protein n=1 Tax=Solanum lycopersicum TaxID=4081 RepID=A0A3Q7FA23_SOLLC
MNLLSEVIVDVDVSDSGMDLVGEFKTGPLQLLHDHQIEGMHRDALPIAAVGIFTEPASFEGVPFSQWQVKSPESGLDPHLPPDTSHCWHFESVVAVQFTENPPAMAFLRKTTEAVGLANATAFV